MIAALVAAGFSGVGEDAGVIHARLSASSVEFTARPEGEAWVLAIQWPVRATLAQMAAFAGRHPGVVLDICQGETRMRMTVAEGDAAALHLWAARAEDMVAEAIRWRRAQRAPGEGM